MSGGQERAALVVEDHEGLRVQVASELRGRGFAVAEAWDGTGALAAWRARGSGGFAVVVLDNQIPGAPGELPLPHAVALARMVLGDKRYTPPAVIVYSGDDLSAECRELGVTYLPKGDALPSDVAEAAVASIQGRDG